MSGCELTKKQGHWFWLVASRVQFWPPGLLVLHVTLLPESSSNTACIYQVEVATSRVPLEEGRACGLQWSSGGQGTRPAMMDAVSPVLYTIIFKSGELTEVSVWLI